MSDETQLFDMQSTRGSPDEVELGESWRSTQVYRCRVCHTETNKWVVGGYPSRGPRLRCPARDAPAHEQMEDLLERREDIQDRLAQYSTAGREADDVLEHLRDERAVIDGQVEDLREEVGDQYDDVEGIEDQRDVVLFSP